MADLPEAIRSYFEALVHGLPGLLPPCRVENKAFLLSLHEAMETEEHLTVPDLEHLKTIMALADREVFPAIYNVQTCCDAETALLQAFPVEGYSIRLAMRWLLFLLGRHGRIDCDLAHVDKWLRIWRRVQVFAPGQRVFISDAICWMLGKGFASSTIQGHVREYQKFRAWMAANGLDSLGQIGNIELQRYLLDRACGYRHTSKQTYLGRVKPWLYYYQEAVDGSYQVPDCTVHVPWACGTSVSANGEEIDRLEEAMLAGKLPAMAGLMLVLVIGYGLPLKLLPLLETTGEPGFLRYMARLPCRKGGGEGKLSLDLSLPWLASYWQSWMAKREAGEAAYLFTSGHGRRRLRPVSVEYCQQVIKAAVQKVLGYPIPANHLERGAIRRLARHHSLTHFMVLTDSLPKSHLARMMYWLAMASVP